MTDGYMVKYPKTNSKFAPQNRPGSKRKRSSSNHQFSGAILVSGRVVVVP